MSLLKLCKIKIVDGIIILEDQVPGFWDPTCFRPSLKKGSYTCNVTFEVNNLPDGTEVLIPRKIMIDNVEYRNIR